MTAKKKRKTEAQLRAEENKALGGFIQLDTVPGGIIPTTPRAVSERTKRISRIVAAQNAAAARKKAKSKKK